MSFQKKCYIYIYHISQFRNTHEDMMETFGYIIHYNTME